MQSENITNLLEAILSARNEVKANIPKNNVVGSGRSAYNSINDEQVRSHSRDALNNNGLVILPVDLQEETRGDAWTDTSGSYPKRKYKNTTSLKVTYRIMHSISGEWMQCVSFGIGIDPADKGAGKALTYALKSLVLDLLYLVKSKDDDGDNTHSGQYEAPTGQAAALAEGKVFISTKEEVGKLLEWVEAKQQKGCRKTDLYYILNEKYTMPKDVTTSISNHIENLFTSMKN